MTKVKDLMNPHPIFIDETTTLREAAQKMRALDCGILPVGRESDIKGIITDRDIIIRAIYKDVNASNELVTDYMTTTIHYCNEDDSVEEAADEMRKHNISRLLVKNGAGVPSGILSFGCILRNGRSLGEIGKVIECAVGEKAA